MSAVTFDTLKFVEKLETGGFTHAQAKAAAEAFAEATGQELATKSDIATLRITTQADALALRAESKADLAAFRSEVNTDLLAFRADFKADIARLETRLETGLQSLEQRMTIKLGGLLVVAIGILLSAIRYLPPAQ
jgi:hypothetical protein